MAFYNFLPTLSTAARPAARQIPKYTLTKFHKQGKEKTHMSKKRTISKRKNKNRQDRRAQKSPEQESLQTLPRDITAFLFRQKAPFSLNDIHQRLGDAEHSKNTIRDALEQLIRKGDIVTAGKKHYAINDKGTVFSGKIEKNPRGFGFVTDLQPRQAADFKKDPFLTIKRIGTANHGDTVLIRIKRVRSDGRPEAELIAILERFSEHLTGFFQSGKPPLVHPEDPRYPTSIRIVESVDQDIPDGHVVIVEVLPDPSKQGYVRGKILEVLGSAETIDVQMRMVIEKHNLPHGFPDNVTQETANLSFDERDYSNREDLRHIPHITIDGATAKDFDDAIAVEKRSNGFRLYVSIADVSHFVTPGSALDKEAYLRGTSIYFPDRVIPMLPEKLSNYLCSLVPDEDRLTFSAILDFSATGKLKKKNFCKSVIRSRQRFTYTTVKEIIVDEAAEQRSAHGKLLQLLDDAKQLAEHLHARRMQRGSIGFNIPEPQITLDEEGKIQSIARKKRNFAHQMIEEFMLAANEAVAATFSAKHRNFIYRIHEKPAEEKVDEFSNFAKTLTIELPRLDNSPMWFAKVLENVRNTPAEYVVNNLLLRTMQQARYSPENVGHFGLAATDYTHFTSPIRRYPDLLVHRFLQNMLTNQEKNTLPPFDTLAQQSNHLSKRERTAITAERDMADRLKIFFMEQFIGENFKAVISGLNERVIFVELLDLFISGAMDLSTLEDDYYLYDPKRYWFIGEISGKIYQLGAIIDVTLIDVDRHRQRINFAPAQ